MTRVPTGLRWACHGCGDCCTGHALGPVEPDIAAGLARMHVDWKVERPDGVYLRQVDGACVFLRPDRRCAVHAELGGAAKPGFCREFPYSLLEDPRGMVAVIRATCAGFHRSFRDGEPIGEADVAAAAALPRVVPRARFAPERVEVAPGVVVALADWMTREQAWLERLEGLDLEPPALVAVLRDGPAREAQYAAAFQAIAHALAHVMRGVLAGPAGEAHQVAFARTSLGLLETARAQAPAALDGDARAWLNLLLRSAILGKSWAAWGSVAAGLGVWLFGVELARRTSDGTPAGLAPVLAHWERFVAIPLVRQWVDRARPATVDLWLHAA